MKRFTYALLTLPLFLTVAIAACDSGGDDDEPTFPAEGDLYPAVTLNQCDGTNVTFSDWIASNDVSFITFGAGWCQACQEEAPIIRSKLVAPYAGQSVGITQILVENGRGEGPTATLCDDWVTNLSLGEYDVFTDVSGDSITQHLGAGIANLPLHFVVTSDGVIRFRKLGSLPDNIAQIVGDWLPQQ